MANLVLLLFECDAAKVAAARDAGLSHFIVDWEWRGKYDRQASVDRCSVFPVLCMDVGTVVIEHGNRWHRHPLLVTA